jgi:hypothetical protein
VEAVGGGDAGRLLAAMLQGVKAEIGLAGGVGVAVNGDYATLFAEFGVLDRDQGTGIRDEVPKSNRRSFDSSSLRSESLRMTGY